MREIMHLGALMAISLAHQVVAIPHSGHNTTEAYQTIAATPVSYPGIVFSVAPIFPMTSTATAAPVVVTVYSRSSCTGSGCLPPVSVPIPDAAPDTPLSTYAGTSSSFLSESYANTLNSQSPDITIYETIATSTTTCTSSVTQTEVVSSAPNDTSVTPPSTPGTASSSADAVSAGLHTTCSTSVITHTVSLGPGSSTVIIETVTSPPGESTAAPVPSNPMSPATPGHSTNTGPPITLPTELTGPDAPTASPGEETADVVETITVSLGPSSSTVIVTTIAHPTKAGTGPSPTPSGGSPVGPNPTGPGAGTDTSGVVVTATLSLSPGSSTVIVTTVTTPTEAATGLTPTITGGSGIPTASPVHPSGVVLTATVSLSPDSSTVIVTTVATPTETGTGPSPITTGGSIAPTPPSADASGVVITATVSLGPESSTVIVTTITTPADASTALTGTVGSGGASLTTDSEVVVTATLSLGPDSSTVFVTTVTSPTDAATGLTPTDAGGGSPTTESGIVMTTTRSLGPGSSTVFVTTVTDSAVGPLPTIPGVSAASSSDIVVTPTPGAVVTATFSLGPSSSTVVVSTLVGPTDSSTLVGATDSVTGLFPTGITSEATVGPPMPTGSTTESGVAVTVTLSLGPGSSTVIVTTVTTEADAHTGLTPSISFTESSAGPSIPTAPGPVVPSSSSSFALPGIVGSLGPGDSTEPIPITLTVHSRTSTSGPAGSNPLTGITPITVPWPETSLPLPSTLPQPWTTSSGASEEGTSTTTEVVYSTEYGSNCSTDISPTPPPTNSVDIPGSSATSTKDAESGAESPTSSPTGTASSAAAPDDTPTKTVSYEEVTITYTVSGGVAEGTFTTDVTIGLVTIGIAPTSHSSKAAEPTDSSEPIYTAPTIPSIYESWSTLWPLPTASSDASPVEASAAALANPRAGTVELTLPPLPSHTDSPMSGSSVLGGLVTTVVIPFPPRPSKSSSSCSTTLTTSVKHTSTSCSESGSGGPISISSPFANISTHNPSTSASSGGGHSPTSGVSPWNTTAPATSPTEIAATSAPFANVTAPPASLTAPSASETGRVPSTPANETAPAASQSGQGGFPPTPPANESSAAGQGGAGPTPASNQTSPAAASQPGAAPTAAAQSGAAPTSPANETAPAAQSGSVPTEAPPASQTQAAETSGQGQGQGKLVQATPFPNAPSLESRKTQGCGTSMDTGNQMMTFEDLYVREGLHSIPMVNSYRRFTFATGSDGRFDVVKLPSMPFMPSSGQQMLQWTPGTSTRAALIGMPTAGKNACFRFNLLSLNVGCVSDEAACSFKLTGRVPSGDNQDEEVIVRQQAFNTTRCQSHQRCKLQPIMIDPVDFTNLTSVAIQLVAGNDYDQPWWLDDLRVGWTNDDCDKGLCRSKHLNQTGFLGITPKKRHFRKMAA